MQSKTSLVIYIKTGIGASEKIIDLIKDNLDFFTDSFSVRFKKFTKKNKNEMADLGITQVPAMIINGQIYEGSVNILKVLNTMILQDDEIDMDEHILSHAQASDDEDFSKEEEKQKSDVQNQINQQMSMKKELLKKAFGDHEKGRPMPKNNKQIDIDESSLSDDEFDLDAYLRDKATNDF